MELEGRTLLFPHVRVEISVRVPNSNFQIGRWTYETVFRREVRARHRLWPLSYVSYTEMGLTETGGQDREDKGKEAMGRSTLKSGGGENCSPCC